MSDFSHAFDNDIPLGGGNHDSQPVQTTTDFSDPLGGFTPSFGDPSNMFDDLLEQLDNEVSFIQGSTDNWGGGYPYGYNAQAGYGGYPNNAYGGMSGPPQGNGGMYYVPAEANIDAPPSSNYGTAPLYPTYAGVPVPATDANSVSSGEQQQPTPSPPINRYPPPSGYQQPQQPPYYSQQQSPPPQFLTADQINRRIEYEIRYDEQQERIHQQRTDNAASANRLNHKRKNKTNEVYPGHMSQPNQEDDNQMDAEMDRISPLTVTSNSSNNYITIIPPSDPSADSPVQNTSSHGKGSASKQHTPSTVLVQFPVNLFQAFNAGDISKVRELVHDCCTKDCALKTPSLQVELYGQSHVVDLFQALSDAHPDAVFVAKKCRYSPEEHAVKANIYFAGTRIGSTIQPQYSYGGTVKQECPASSANGGSVKLTTVTCSMKDHEQYLKTGPPNPFMIKNEFLFRQPNTSILKQMDTSMLTEAEIASMMELERTSKNLTVFGKGNWTLTLTKDLTKISHLDLHYVISSFRDAEIAI